MDADGDRSVRLPCKRLISNEAPRQSQGEGIIYFVGLEAETANVEDDAILAVHLSGRIQGLAAAQLFLFRPPEWWTKNEKKEQSSSKAKSPASQVYLPTSLFHQLSQKKLLKFTNFERNIFLAINNQKKLTATYKANLSIASSPVNCTKKSTSNFVIFEQRISF